MSTEVGRNREEEFNFALRDVLRETRVRYKVTPSPVNAEQTGVLSGRENAGKRPDILIVEPRFPPVVIECSFSASDADQDARSRLGLSAANGFSEIRTALSVHIPALFQSAASPKEELTGEACIGYALYHKTGEGIRRWPDRGFIQGSVQDMASLLSSAILPKEDIERVAAQVADLVDQASCCLESLPQSTHQKIDELIKRGSVLMSLKTAMVLWLNALLIQQRLHMQDVEHAPALDFSSAPLPLHTQQVEVWRKIQKQNWRAIFDPAIEVLEMVGNSDLQSTGQALKHLVSAVQKIEMAGLGLHINVGAELFPKLSEDRKQAAAFYTQAATAELLASLTIRGRDLPSGQWSDGTIFSDRCMADLACGTGTLLRAGYRRIQAFHEVNGGSIRSVSRLHRGAMESGVIGTDISPIAAHLTSSSLAAIGMGEPYGETRIGWMNVGGEKSATGSLEYFHRPNQEDMMGRVAGGHSHGDGSSRDYSVLIDDSSIDWILMNPPYSRTRGGQSAFDITGLSDRERTACQKRWRQLTGGKPCNAKAGMAASFLVLAREKVKPGGRIGFVLPMTAAFADSWAVTRRMIELEFEDIVAVCVASGQALGEDAFSADTGMEEMLLVATRRIQSSSGMEEVGVKCVTLNSPVTRLGEAGEVARAIEHAVEHVSKSSPSRPIMIAAEEIGVVCNFASRGDGEPWGMLGTVHSDLANAAVNLSHGRLEFLNTSLVLECQMTTIEELFQVGPTHHLIGHVSGNSEIGAFEMFPVAGETDAVGSDRSLWTADAQSQRHLVVSPTHKGAPVNDGCDEMRSRQGRLFYARNMRWTSQSLLAAMTRHEVMGGSAWAALQHDDLRVCKAFALWANSSLGMIVHWTRGQRTHSGRSRTQIGALRQMPCAGLDQLDDASLDYAASRFDELAGCELLPACQAHADKTRIEIDSIVAEIAGLPQGTVDVIRELRWLWCNEPSVHGQNRQALRQLDPKKQEICENMPLS
ncbi:MAG: hypothetical protein OXF73_10295 [Gammaproteobacteria bacterium]|nr:hypothetical protein [Gammaproteobacteria bacterium]